MPYEMMQRGDKFCVVKRGDGKVMGCHSTQSEAAAQMAAIHANEKSLARKMHRKSCSKCGEKRRGIKSATH